jgi:hypothetical protein
MYVFQAGTTNITSTLGTTTVRVTPQVSTPLMIIFSLLRPFRQVTIPAGDRVGLGYGPFSSLAVGLFFFSEQCSATILFHPRGFLLASSPCFLKRRTLLRAICGTKRERQRLDWSDGSSSSSRHSSSVSGVQRRKVWNCADPRRARLQRAFGGATRR